MKKRAGRWVAAFAVGFVLLVLLGPALPPPKARAQRIQGVNNLAPPFPKRDFVLPDMVATNGGYPMMTR